MLTPSFELQQNNDFLILTIKAPYVKANEVEIYIDEYDFKFYVKPYFLRLTFPCKVIEDGKEHASYDIHKGIFTIIIPKLQSGEFFPNLDMLTLLLANKKKQPSKPLVEVLAADSNQMDDAESSNQMNDVDSDDEFTWEIEQTLNSESELDHCHGNKYGFCNKYYGLFSSFKGEMSEVVDLDSPEDTTPSDRQRLRKLADAEKFNKDHYIADFLDEELIKPLLEFCPPWSNFNENLPLHEELLQDSCQTEGLIKKSLNLPYNAKCHKFEFTEDEKYQLMQLPHNDHILSNEDETICFLSLVDILLSYCYDMRTTEAEHTTCSAWTISKLSSTLSWLEVHKSLKEVLVSFASRCLCYPLYRNWYLIIKVIDDTRNLFLLGKSYILRCLLDMKKIFQKDENRYLLNELYINDYCVWIQKQSNVKITSLGKSIENTKICKDDISFNLREIEKEALREHIEYESPLSSSIDEDFPSNSSSLSNTDSDDTDSDGISDTDSDGNIAISLNSTGNLFSKQADIKSKHDAVDTGCYLDESKIRDCENRFNAVNNDVQYISTGLKSMKDLHNYAGTSSYKNNRLFKDSISPDQKSAYFDEKDDQDDATDRFYDNHRSYHYKSTGNSNQLDQQSFPSYSTDDVRYDQKDKSKSNIKNDPADELRQAANRYHQELIKNYPKFRHSIFLNDNASKMTRKVSNQPENTFNRGEPTRATIASTSSTCLPRSISVNNSSDLCDMNNLLRSNNSIMGRLLNDQSQEASLYKIDETNAQAWPHNSKGDTSFVQSNHLVTQTEASVIQNKETEDCSQIIDERLSTPELASNDTFMNRLDRISSIADSTKSSRFENTQDLYFRSSSPVCTQNLVSTNVYPNPNALYGHEETDIDSPEAEALIHQRALSSDSAVYLSENQHKCDLNNQYTSMSDLDIISLKHSAQSDSDDINLLPPPPDDLLCDEITNETNIEREKPQRTINRKKNNYYGLNSRNNSCVSTDSTTSTGTADSGIGVRSDNSPSPISNDDYFLNKPLYGSQECLDDDVAELDMPHSASTPDHCTDNYAYNDETDFSHRICSYNKTESTECLATGKKVNELDGEKSKLIESMREKINELRLQEQEITDEIRVNDNLGKMVLNMVESKATQSEFSKFELFIGELNKIVALLLSLTQRLHRYELMLQELDMSNEEDKMKKDGLISKIAKLQSQLEEACYLKDVNNKRGDNVALFLEKYCTDDEISDYQYYIDMKSQLALMQSEIREKVKLGEERLSALERTGSEWEFSC